MDSEAAASLLDLSKSRHPPSLQDEISMEMSVSHANTISLNELPRSTIASVLQTSEKARHDDHFFSSAGSVIKNYNFVEGKHVCPICQKTFPKEHSLSLHKNVHYMEKPYRCGKCQATFQSNWLLKRHQNIVHHLSKSLYDPRPFKCLECKVAFRTRGHLAKHARSKVHSEKIKSKSAKCISDENDEDGRESYDCIETSSGTHMPSFTPAIIQDSFVHNSSMNSGTSKTSSQAVSNLYNCDGHQDQFQGQVSSPDSTLHKLKQSIEPRSLTLNDLAINEAMLEFHTDENSISQISEAKPKKLSFIGKSRCCDTEQMGTETIFNHTGPTGDLDDVSKSLSQKYLKLQDYQTSLITSNSDASSVKEDAMMFPCCVCSTACEDPLSLLNHYESHLEQRVHICLICDAGFKTQESLNGHLNLHCEKHSMGIQTQENEILGEFLRKCDSSLKIPMMASPHPQDSLRVLPHLGNPANCLSTVGGGKTFLQLPQSNVSSIVPCLSQKCIMSSGQWALQQSNLHLPANPIQQVTKLQHLEPEVKNDTFPKLSQLITDEGFPATHPASHLLLQPVSISNNISLFPQNTYLLVPSEASKGDTSPNHGEVLFFDPSAGCFFAASGRSLIGSATPVTKSLSSLAIPVESHNSIKPV